MIGITYNEMGDVMILQAEGHAGFAPKGQDIVCAAVSALMQTLAYSLDGGTVTYANDRNRMEVQAKQSTDSLTKFELVTDGLILLANAYPEHVQYVNLHADKTDAMDLQMFASATTTAASGGNREELLGPRPAGHEHKTLCEVDAGSRNPLGGFRLQLFADGGSTSSAADAAASPQGEAIELPKLRPAEERLARRSGVLKRNAGNGSDKNGMPSQLPVGGMPSQSAQSAASSPKGGANASAGAGAAGGEPPHPSAAQTASPQGEANASDPETEANRKTGEGEEKARTPEERKKAFQALMQGEYKAEAEEMVQRAVQLAAQRLEASPAMKGLMEALAETYGTDASDLIALTEAVKNGAVKDDAYYEKLAMEKGVSTKTARELDKLESRNRQLTAQQEAAQQLERQRAQQARMAELQAGWDREAAALKAQYPDFDQAEVLANPEVSAMMRAGVSMTNAYRSAYFDHILQQQQAATARQVEQGVVARQQQRAGRPGENGTRPGGAVQTKFDVSHMTRKEAEDIEKRVMRGEIITL